MSDTQPEALDVAGQLPDDVRAVVERARLLNTRSERVKRWGIVYIAAIMTVVGPVVTWVGITGNSTLSAVRATQIDNVARAVETKAAATSSETVLNTLQDCLTPGGTCYRRTQANTQHVLAQVTRLFTFAELCGTDTAVPHNLPAQESCVEQLIKEHGLG